MTKQPIKFTKMHGLGNDFVVINGIEHIIDWKLLPAKKIADRHLGIGCDQILLIEPSTSADFFCRIINADGSEAEQCGNGLRCVARFVHEKGLQQGNHFTLETIAGVFPVEIKDYDHIRVTIAARIESSSMQLSLTTLGTEVSGSALSIGNPHFIIKVADLQTTQTDQIGPAVSSHPSFPHGTNVGFMQVVSPDHIRLRTYERGAGETHACGSNACAAVAAGILDGSLHHAVTVEFHYGQLKIEWEGKNKPVHMNGPACTVFEGEITLTK